MYEKQDGSLLVRDEFRLLSLTYTHPQPGNYDVTKMHYDGPGDVPGAPAGGYGYKTRVRTA